MASPHGKVNGSGGLHLQQSAPLPAAQRQTRPPPAAQRQPATSVLASRRDIQPMTLATIPSQCEMLDGEDDSGSLDANEGQLTRGNGDSEADDTLLLVAGEYDRGLEPRRRALSSCSGRRLQRNLFHPSPSSRAENNNNSNGVGGGNTSTGVIGRGVGSGGNNRSRAASHDIILTFNDVLPSYNDELAGRIAAIEGEYQQQQQQRYESQSYSTPERCPQFVRERSYTSPRSRPPSRYSLFQREPATVDGAGEGVGSDSYRDEESGHIVVDSLRDGQQSAATSSYSSPTSNRRALQQSHSNPQQSRWNRSNNNNSADIISRERADTCPHQASQRSGVTFDFSEDNGSILFPELEVDSADVDDGTAVVTQQRLDSRELNTPAGGVVPAARASVSLLSTPSPARRASTPRAPHSSPLIITANSNISISTPIIPSRPQNFRMNLIVMKALMLLSLYMLLAYSWNTDFRFRYKSTEINYGLSEYWNGAIPSLGKIGKETGKLFNDYTGDEDVKAKLLKGVVANDNLPSASKDGIELSIGDGEMDEKKKRRPSLSYARSIPDGSTTFGGHLQSRRVQRYVMPISPKSSRWSQFAWCVVWVAFTLPIVEAGLREVRRQFRLVSIRRPRTFRRAASSVHDL